MSVPTISPLPEAPSKSDSKTQFDNKAFNLVDALNDFVNESNALAAWMNSNIGPSPIVDFSGTSLTLSAANSGGYLRASNSGSKTLNTPNDPEIDAGAQWLIFNVGEGNLTIMPGEGVTVTGSSLVPSFGAGILKKITNTTYDFLPFSGSGGSETDPTVGAVTQVDILNGSVRIIGFYQVVKGMVHFTFQIKSPGAPVTFDLSGYLPYPEQVADDHGDPIWGYTYQSQRFDLYEGITQHAYLNIQETGIWQLVSPFPEVLEDVWLHFNGCYPVSTAPV